MLLSSVENVETYPKLVETFEEYLLHICGQSSKVIQKPLFGRESQIILDLVEVIKAPSDLGRTKLSTFGRENRNINELARDGRTFSGLARKRLYFFRVEKVETFKISVEMAEACLAWIEQNCAQFFGKKFEAHEFGRSG